jgi:SAM-dependent methyltransferase
MQLSWNQSNFNAHHRNFEVEFVLKYLADLSWVDFGKKGNSGIAVLDIGSTESLLLYEIEKRGYVPMGLDIRPYHTILPETAYFFQGDITNYGIVDELKNTCITFIVALSSIEHIGLPVYGSRVIPNGDRLAVQNIHKILDDNGYFIITVPMKYWQTDSGRGYTPKEFRKLIHGLFNIFELTTGGGQICAALVKL